MSQFEKKNNKTLVHIIAKLKKNIDDIQTYKS